MRSDPGGVTRPVRHGLSPRTKVGFLGVAGLVFLGALSLATSAQAATRFVNSNTGSNVGDCTNPATPCKTITYALTQAAANDTIQIAAGTYDNTVNGELFPLVIAVNLTLTGAGAPTTIIDADGTARVITVNGGVTVAISGVTITDGAVSCGSVGCSAQGGGLFNNGTLTLTNVTVSGNTASCGGGGCSAQGGGLFNLGTLTVTNSTVSGNTASGGAVTQGGGLLNLGTLTLTNVTVSGNTASCGAGGCVAQGGGLFNDDTSLTLTNVTVSGNTASCGGGGCSAQGGGLLNFGTLTLTATIVAKQLADADCVNVGTITSNGFNLDSDNTCGLTGTGDKPGVSNPLLGPLQNNGGPTHTHALLPGSPALDMVLSGCPPPDTDQRGVSRPQGTFCDIGAYELQVTIPTLSEWAQLGMLALLLGGGLFALRRRVRPA